jgi:hypothetical protein
VNWKNIVLPSSYKHVESNTKIGENTTYLNRQYNHEDHELGTGLFLEKRVMSAVKTVECDSDRMS